MAEWQDPRTLAIWLGVTMVIFIVLVGFIILIVYRYIKSRINELNRVNQMKLDHQNDMLVNSIRVQERERSRISAEIHDQLIAQMGIAQLTMVNDNVSSDTVQLIENSIHLARNISHELMPPLIQNSPLKELMSDFIFPLRTSYDIKLYDHFSSNNNFPAEIKLHIFRIFQEIISNIIKHSSATGIAIQYRQTFQSLAILVCDNGRGFDHSAKRSGLGFKNIELRVRLIHGKYRIQSKVGKGTSILLWIENLYLFENKNNNTE